MTQKSFSERVREKTVSSGGWRRNGVRHFLTWRY